MNKTMGDAECVVKRCEEGAQRGKEFQCSGVVIRNCTKAQYLLLIYNNGASSKTITYAHAS